MSNRYTIRVPELGGSCTEPDVKSALAHIETLLSDGFPGDTITVEVVEISDAEYARLPEFTGW